MLPKNIAVATVTSLVFLLRLALVKGLNSPQPFISISSKQLGPQRPTRKFVDLQDGTNTTLHCQGLQPLEWSYPDIDAKHLGQQFRFSDSRASQTSRYDNETGFHYSDLHLALLSVNDTGPVFCRNRGRQERSSVFLFVGSPSQLHVGSRPIYMFVTEGKPSTVPCIATSSKTRTELLIDGDKKDSDHHDKLKGFTAYDAYNLFSSRMICRFTNEHENFTQEQTVYSEFRGLTVELEAPVIEVVSGRRTFLASEQVEIRCRAKTNAVASNDTWPIAFAWWLPSKFLNKTVVKEQKCYVGTALPTLCTGTLTIRSAELAHGGNYKCMARHLDLEYSSTSASVTLQVIENASASIVNVQDMIETVLRSPAMVVNVSVVAVPVPSAAWFKDGQILETDFADGKRSARLVRQHDSQYLLQLEVHNITAHDAGNYSIQIYTGNTSAFLRHSMVVRVSGPPALVVQPSSFEVHHWLPSTSTPQFHCKGYGYPTPRVWWQYQECLRPGCTAEPSAWKDIGLADVGGNRSRELSLGDASSSSANQSDSLLSVLPRRSALYRCAGENKVARETAQAVRVIINEVSGDTPLGFASDATHYTGVIGDIFRLTCYASKWMYSQPEILWKRGNSTSFSVFDLSEENITKTMVESNHSFVTDVSFIVSSKVSALYACRAKSAHTTVEVVSARVVKLDVVDVSPVRVVPDSNMTSLIVSVGSTAIIDCTVEGNPRPVITWLRNGDALNPTAANVRITSSDVGQNLTIPRVHMSDAGVYTCLAANKYGSALLNKTLYVFDASLQLQSRDSPATPTYTAAAAVAGACVAISAITIALFLRCKKIKKPPEPCELLLPSKVFINPDIPIDEQTDCLPYDMNWEFPRERLRLGMVLGQGAFGRVLRAEAVGIEHNAAVSTVAVKTVREPDNMDHIKALISELKILIHVGQHLNIVNLLGAVTRNLKRGELLVIVEYCRFGNLRNYLLEHRSDYVDTLETASGSKLAAILSKPPPHRSMPRDSGISTLRESVTSEDYLCPRSPVEGQNGDVGRVEPLTTFDLLCWCFQIARGMKYLASIQYIHRDLAARNVLLCDDNIVKICDFGLAKDIYKYNEYKKTTDGPLPIKWMALESLTHKLFTTASDVWSYGVTLWELFSLAATPYPGVELNEMFIERLQAGYRMEQPKHSPDDVYDIMLRCWHPDASKRPTFSQLSTELGNMLHESVRNHYLALEEPYIRLKELHHEPSPSGSRRSSEQEYTASEDYLEPLSSSQGTPSSEVAPSEPTYATGIQLDDDGYYNALLHKEMRSNISTKGSRVGVIPGQEVELSPLIDIGGRRDQTKLEISCSKVWATENEDALPLSSDQSQNLMETSDKVPKFLPAVETVC